MADFPVGTVAVYGGDASNAAVLANLGQSGWLLCDGSQFPITDYKDLAAVVGSLYGGDGRTTFGVPDLRGLFVRGLDRGRGKDPDGQARTINQLQQSATGRPTKPFVLQQGGQHSHNVDHVPDDDHHTAAAGAGSPQPMEWDDDSVTTSTDGAHSHTINSGGDAETRPANVYVYYLIKATAIAGVDDVVVGTVVPFAGDARDATIRTALNQQGWMLCDGSSLSTTQYDVLFGMIGTSYGTGSGDGSFSLPDVRGLFVTGPRPARLEASVEPYTTALPSNPFSVSSPGDHTHEVPHLPDDSSRSDYSAGHDQAAWNSGSESSSSNGAHTHTVVSGGDAESRPINLAMDFIIKVQEPQG